MKTVISKITSDLSDATSLSDRPIDTTGKLSALSFPPTDSTKYLFPFRYQTSIPNSEPSKIANLLSLKLQISQSTHQPGQILPNLRNINPNSRRYLCSPLTPKFIPPQQ